MTKRDSCIGGVKWTVTVPAELDESVRRYLASRGKGVDGLSELVQKAVAGHLLSLSVRECKEEVRKAGLTQQELERSLKTESPGRKSSPLDGDGA